MATLEERILLIEKNQHEINDRLAIILEHIQRIERSILPNKCGWFKSSNTGLICDNCGKHESEHYKLNGTTSTDLNVKGLITTDC